MDQLNDYADSRLINGCIYCGGPEETRDHVPSRVFLDSPFPTNLPVVPACWVCNNSFSKDEEYLACLVETVTAGSTDPDQISRSRVAGTLRRSPALRSQIESGKKDQDGYITFAIDRVRVENVILKLARGHAAFELSTICREEPCKIDLWQIDLMTGQESDSFEACHVTDMFGEVGCRGIQRQLVTQVTLKSLSTGQESTMGLIVTDWIEVQEGRYRYLASHDLDGIKVKIVIGEYLACEVSWD